MTLRTKTLLIVGLTLLLLFVVLFVTLSAVLTNGFEQVEELFVTRNVTRAKQALDADIDSLGATAADWSIWDDSYFFIQGDPEYADYVDSNGLSDESVLTNLGVNAVIYLDSADDTVVRQDFDLEEGVFIEEPEGAISESVLAYLDNDPSLLDHSDFEENPGHAGLVLLPEDPALVASIPILTTNGSGPPQGTVIMTYYLNDAQIEALAERTQFEITVHRLDTGDIPGDFESALAEINNQMANEGSDIFITPIGGGCTSGGTEFSDCIAGYSILDDLSGEHALIMRVAIPRDVFAQGQDTLRIFIFALLGVALVFIIVLLVILERLVLARLATVSEGVVEIGHSGDLSKRLNVQGSDELANLSTTINQMLTDLQASLAREKELRAEVQQLRIEIDLAKQQQQVAEITETDYFADLQDKARKLREDKGEEGSGEGAGSKEEAKTE